jgi:hypothetical protein
MLKKVLLATAMTGLVAGIAVLVQTSPAEAQMTCRQAAKMQHPSDRKARRAYRKACRDAAKAQAAAAKPAGPTYAGDM